MSYRIVSVIFCLAWAGAACGQPLSNVRQHYVLTGADTVAADTLSIIPGTFFLTHAGEIISDTSAYEINYGGAMLVWKKNSEAYKALRLKADSVLAVYRVFPILFTQTVRHRSRSIIEKKYSGIYNPYEYTEKEKQKDFFRIEGLSKSGSISRGVSFGNTQDVVVNSSLNLQLAGKLSDDVEVLAAITDNNIPVQPEGNTQQLNEFDKVFIRLSKNRTSLTAGDFDLDRPESYFMNFYKKGQGGIFSTEFHLNDDTVSSRALMRVTASGAVSKGKYARNIFNGIEANQGPYKLRGAENELFIIILSGSEKIYMDGMLLTRGQEFDYVIDYNTAELMFTAKRIVTKDKRIVAEFQYSEKNFARSLIYLNDEFETRKLKLKMNVYSEQDSKNQPLLQDLNDNQKLFLAGIGDSTQQAFYENIDSVAFNANEVLYARIDSGGYVFYRYSTDSTVAHFRLGFANVGANKGNYVQIISSANGRVFEWRAPVAGALQGSYEPVTLLITPRRQQMVTLGADYAVAKNSRVTMDGAFTNYDINLFSKIDKKNDKGYAVSAGFSHLFPLGKDTVNGWMLNTGVQGEHINKNFIPIETFRNIEFTRDWNLTGFTAPEDENSGALLLGLMKGREHQVNYKIKSFVRGKQYNGYNNSLTGFSNYKSFKLVYDGSYLITTGSLSKTTFLRINSDVSKKSFNRIITGLRFMQERNSRFAPATDSLLPVSFYNHTEAAYITNADTSKIKFRTDYARRYDYAVKENDFRNSTIADDASASVEWTKSANSRLAVSGNYRNLKARDTLLSAQPSGENLLTRVEYNITAWKGAVVSNTFYEVGTGQELKREFSYVKVTDGTGVYAWNDYNKDGIPQLNEFEIAAFKDQANYIRVFLSTNEFVKSRFNQLSQVLSLNPAAISKREKKSGRIISRFADQFSMRLDNKTTKENFAEALNPFENNVNDSLLISTNTSFRNTVFYNRTSTTFGMDFTYENNSQKTLLTNGFETRTQERYNSNIRWNITRAININQFGETGEKENKSEFFSERNFLIRSYASETKFNLQPGVSWRFTLLYGYKDRTNAAGDAGEKLIQNRGGAEIRFSSVKKGILSASFNIIQNSFNADENNSLAYEMLEGLKRGTNYTWNLSVQRNLSGNVQMNLNYDGRKSENSPMIHTGGVELRAFF